MNIKKLFQHNKNRERELAIAAKKTEEAQKARAEGTLTISVPKVSSTSGFEEQAQSMAGLETQEVTQENVSQACKAMSTQIRLSGNGECRKQVLLHLPSEILKVLAGRTSQEAFEFYWSLDAFRKVWEELQFTENDLRGFINSEVVKLCRTDLLEEVK